MSVDVLHHCKTKNCPDLQLLHDAINKYTGEYAYLTHRIKESEDALKELKEIVESRKNSSFDAHLMNQLKKVIEKLEVKPLEFYISQLEQKK